MKHLSFDARNTNTAIIDIARNFELDADIAWCRAERQYRLAERRCHHIARRYHIERHVFECFMMFYECFMMFY